MSRSIPSRNQGRSSASGCWVDPFLGSPAAIVLSRVARSPSGRQTECSKWRCTQPVWLNRSATSHPGQVGTATPNDSTGRAPMQSASAWRARRGSNAITTPTAGPAACPSRVCTCRVLPIVPPGSLRPATHHGPRWCHLTADGRETFAAQSWRGAWRRVGERESLATAWTAVASIRIAFAQPVAASPPRDEDVDLRVAPSGASSDYTASTRTSTGAKPRHRPS